MRCAQVVLPRAGRFAASLGAFTSSRSMLALRRDSRQLRSSGSGRDVQVKLPAWFGSPLPLYWGNAG